jgi:single-strand DNA-binding protein
MSTPVTLTGRLAADPTLSFSGAGKAIARFTVVTSGRRKNKDTQEWEDADVSWWRCTAFDQLAENIAEYMTKGTAVLAQGTASQDDWTDKEGNSKTSLKCIVNNFGEDLRWRKPKGEASRGGSQSYDDSVPF